MAVRIKIANESSLLAVIAAQAMNPGNVTYQ